MLYIESWVQYIENCKWLTSYFFLGFSSSAASSSKSESDVNSSKSNIFFVTRWSKIWADEHSSLDLALSLSLSHPHPTTTTKTGAKTEAKTGAQTSFFQLFKIYVCLQLSWVRNKQKRVDLASLWKSELDPSFEELDPLKYTTVL